MVGITTAEKIKTRTARNRKGYLRLIEMSFAAALILAFLIFIQQTQSTIQSGQPKFGPAVLKMLGQDVLRGLDLTDNTTAYRNFKRDLSEMLKCDASQWALAANISERLPQNVGFTIYSVNGDGVATYKGGVQEAKQPTRSEMVAVNYIVAGEYGNYSNFGKPCAIRLVLWFNI